MNRWTKIILRSFALLAGLAALAIVATIVVWGMESEGVWPFDRLGTYHREIALPNGGKLLLEGKEFRGFGERGHTETASYQPPGSENAEPFGNWQASQIEPRVFLSGVLVVVLSPDSTTVYVRKHVVSLPTEHSQPELDESDALHSLIPTPPADEGWRSFSMQFPSENSLPLSFYSRNSGLSEDDLLRVREDLNEEEKKWSPSTYLQSFDPNERRLVVSYRVGMETTRYLHLLLSEDGDRLSLTGIERRNLASASR